jgi:hypothetical protein
VQQVSIPNALQTTIQIAENRRGAAKRQYSLKKNDAAELRDTFVLKRAERRAQAVFHGQLLF